MAAELFIPKLGQTVEEVTLINWLVKDGDKVEQGQEVLEVETDKAVFDVEAVDDGYIHFGPFKAGDVVPVLEVVAVIGEKDEVFQKAEKQAAEEPEKQEAGSKKATSIESPQQAEVGEIAEEGKVFASPRARKLAVEKKVDLRLVKATGGGGIRVTEKDVLDFLSRKVKISPVAKRMAEQNGLDIRAIQGSGHAGEITKEDIETALTQRTSVAGAQKSSISLPTTNINKSTPISGVRRVIAQRMSQSAQTTARVTLFLEANATDFVAVREKLKAQFKPEWGFAPGYNELIAKVCAITLRAYPYMNARISDESIEQLADVNIGIAVDAEQGLTVPVIKNIDRKDLHTVGSEFRQRVEEVRSGKIHPDHLSGGTFTITNLGMYDVDGFTPIINLPEAAILGVGRIAPKVVVLGDQFGIRKMLTLSLAFDHRLTDGAPAARFLQHIKELIETPDEDALVG